MATLPTMNVIGTGKLGGTLIREINQLQLGDILACYNQSTKISIDQLPYADITFICTPDELIPKIASMLADSLDKRKQTPLAIHFSGALNSDALAPLKLKGWQVASLHPMRSFHDPSHATFKKAFCALEGMDSAKEIIKTIFSSLELKMIEISTESKPLYHAGGVFSSNYLVAVLNQGMQCYQQAGIDSTTSFQMMFDLAKSTINNIEQTQDLSEALTGPLSRGDSETLRTHLKVLENDEKNLYWLLAKKLLTLTKLSEAKKNEIIHILNGSKDAH